ncbi:DNA repair protein RadA [Candidatus Microgenomates bacterium]|nr:DNA repair protein RadA [Candidatus Microgenomates bacterium]
MAFYICTNCNFGSASFLGKCPDCGEFNTLVKADDDVEKPRHKEEVKKLKLTSLSKVQTTRKERRKTGIAEFDRVLGGGIIPGAVILLTGEPGIGKSTLLLQALKDMKVIYVSGEESAEQIRDRAERLSVNMEHFYFSDDLQIEGVIKGAEEEKDLIELLVIDSIQTVYSKEVEATAGSVTQLRETTNKLVTFAKRTKMPIIIIGHVTKDGEIAGPKTLEHLVDTVLLFEGEKVSNHRVLRANKNRFGSTDEIGIFEMNESGLAEVSNPLAFLDDLNSQEGKSIVGVSEGKRPLFFEIQTLAVTTMLSVPRRVVKGVDYNKVQLLLAVARKYLGLKLDTYDVYVNVVGGIDIKSTAADLGIIASLVSSISGKPLPPKTVYIGEVGLLGEIRPVYFQDRIIDEAKRMKFTSVISSKVIKNIRDLKRS